jgi:hypothetical protein
MQPTGDGRRWCARCERRITDFRGMSDGEIRLVHARSDAPVCGVYDEAQLRPAAPPPSPPRPRLVTLALGATLLSGTASAQAATTERHPSTVQPADASTRPRDGRAAPAKAPTPAHADSFVVRGTVRTVNGRPIRDAVVLVEGTTLHVQTDSLGGYELHVGDRAALPPVLRLRFAQVGPGHRTVEVTTALAESRVDVVLEPPTFRLGVVYPMPEPPLAIGLVEALKSILRFDWLKEWWAAV